MDIKIPKEMTDKYGIVYEPINFYGSEENIYRQFLIATDYICNKIVEGAATWDDYAEERQYRQIARDYLGNIVATEQIDEM